MKTSLIFIILFIISMWCVTHASFANTQNPNTSITKILPNPSTQTKKDPQDFLQNPHKKPPPKARKKALLPVKPLCEEHPEKAKNPGEPNTPGTPPHLPRCQTVLNIK